jgi:hypothetical protein
VIYLLLADAVLILHALFVAFVVFSLFLVLGGGLFGWGWVRNLWFRLAHLLAIGIVVLQSWLGIICPLTHWEMELRALGGETVYAGSFVAYWLHRILFYQAPDWVFTLIYSLFAALVAASWYWVRPGSTRL